MPKTHSECESQDEEDVSDLLKLFKMFMYETMDIIPIFEESNSFNVEEILVHFNEKKTPFIEEILSILSSISQFLEYAISKSTAKDITISTLFDSQQTEFDAELRLILLEHFMRRQRENIAPVFRNYQRTAQNSLKVIKKLVSKTILDVKSLYDPVESLSLTIHKSVIMVHRDVTKDGQSEVLVLLKPEAFTSKHLQILYDKMESALKSLSCHPKDHFKDDEVKTLSGRTPLEAERVKLGAAKFGTVMMANESMKSEQQRRSSFAFWSLSNITHLQELVEAGFYSSDSILEIVECFSCGLSLKVSELNGRNPLDVHRERSPHCQFLHPENIRERRINSTPSQRFESSAIDTIDGTRRERNLQNCSAFNKINEKNDFVSPESDTSYTRSERRRRNITDRHVGEVTEGIQNSLSLNQRTPPQLISQPSDIDADGTGGKTNSCVELALSGKNQNQQLLTNVHVNFSSQRDALVTQRDGSNNAGQIHEEVEGAAAAISNFAPSPSSLAQDSPTPPPRNPRYEQDTARRESFNAWNGRHDIDSLVEAGLFYTGDQDIVRCFHCDIGLAEWNREDDSWQEHARHSHECHFLLRVKGQAYVDDVQREWSKVYSPKRPDLSHVDSRLNTFHNWPRDFVVQTPEQLSIAGFYYAGETDTVRCHYCDGGLREWEPGDIPWVEHAKWFPHCKFVLKIKGLPFIQQCVARRNEVLEDPVPNNAQAENEALNRFRAPISNEEKNRAMEEKNPLYTAAAQAVMAMGYSTAVVTKCINAYIANTGQSNFGASDLMNVILDKEDEGGKLSSDGETGENESNDDDFPFDGPALVKINETLKQEQLCIECRRRGRQILFEPCGHLLLCKICSQKYSHCSRCEVKIKNRVKIYMS